jgi:N-acetyltransferase
VDHNGEVTAAGADPPHSDFMPVADARPRDTAWPVMSWPPPPDIVLVGRVVAVAPVDPERDAEALFEALDDDRVWDHLPFRVSDPDSYAQFLRGRIQTGWFPWVIRLRGPYAGDIAVHDARLEIGATAYRHDVWATAVNPETKLLLLRYAFDDLHAGRVQLKTDVRNTRSQRAIARLGARYDGTLGRYQRRADGTVRDTVLFSVLAEDWPRVRDGLHTRLASSAQMPSTGPNATAPIPASRVEE